MGFCLRVTCCTLACGIVISASGGCSLSDPFGEERAIAPASYEFPIEAGPALPEIKPVTDPDLDTAPLSLAECIRIAFLNSPAARRSWQMTRTEAMRVGRARSPLLPQMDAGAAAVRSMRERQEDVRQVVPGSFPTQMETVAREGDKVYSNEYSVRFGVRQLLFDAGSTRAAVGAAEHALQSANLRHSATLLDVALETQINYYRLLNALALLEVAEDSLRQRQRHLGLAEARFEAGLVHEAEVLQARAREAEARLEIVDARNRIRTIRGRLATTMGLRPSIEFEIRDIPDEVREDELADIAMLMDEAVEERAVLRAAAAEILRLRKLKESEEAARWPELTGSGSIGRRDDSIRPRYDEWSVGLNLNWPLFTGFERSYRVREMESLVDRAMKEYEQELREVEREVWEAYSELLRSKEAIAAADVFVESAEESLRVAERAYEEGRVGIVELTDAQTDATRARGRKVEARLDWHMALSRLERAIGRTMQSGR